MTADLSIVILNFNTSALLRNALNSLKDTKNIKLQIIVVDNASSDDSVAMVNAEFKEVHLIASKKNLGFAGGNNLALPYLEGRFVLFLNSDTTTPADTLGYLVNYLDSHPDIGIITCRVDLKIGGMDLDCHRGFPTPWASLTNFVGLSKLFPKSKLFNQYHLGYLDLGTIHEVDAVTGAFLMVRKAAARDLGYWDDSFFFYGEDLDFCYRYKQAGWKIVYNPQVSIIHYKGASSGIKKESSNFTAAQIDTKRRIARESVRAMRIFYNKHYKTKYPWLLNQLIFASFNFLEWKRVNKYH